MFNDLPPIPRERPIDRRKARLLSPLSRRYRAKAGLADMPLQKQIVYSHCILSHDGKLFFPKNAKAASSTTRRHIVRLATGQFERDAPEVKQGQRHWRAYEAAVRDPQCVKFCITRHPVDRLVSTFCNFFVDEGHPSTRAHMGPIEARGYLRGGDMARNFDVFLAYIGEAHAEGLIYCDPHWRPQYINIAHDEVTYELSGDISDYAKILREAFARAGHGDPFAGEDGSRRFNVSSGGDFEVSAEQRRKIELLFERDYTLYGY
ncbi:sulfotransferase family 2 domain-containing protein [Pseudooceanicola nanhaiensis]|uniref:sulfotransferase family 2 domain-containing protein n=1 Tax=Pseudooceanicola nanhaiensis TaxID=375761 RepID=UPI001CD3B4D0|nr:sulfotransferase family 2 domain-containing protein [Pseudooceanicola nanhaiensis]MCA0920545.1 sulfotransferase family protein [Pseudooceanicola nanhaiensis]